jgi:hypothetical protein
MLTHRAAHYLIHQFPDSGRDVEELAERWKRKYPDEAFDVKEGEDLVVEVQSLLDSGMSLFPAVEAAREGSVVKKKAPKKKAPKKKAPKKKVK